MASNPMLITIVVIAVLGLCCCCCSVGFGINFGESITFMLYDISESLGF